MLLLRTLAPCLLMAFLAQQVPLSSGARVPYPRGRAAQERGGDRTVTPATGRAQGSGGNGAAASGRGKFSTKNKMRCTWGSRDVGDTVKLSVKCENREARVEGGLTDLRCDYDGKPQICPSYHSDTKVFWKQVGRALKRLQGKLCRDDRALLSAGMCKRAPRDAQFKLDISSSVASAQSGDLEPPRPPPPQRVSTVAPAGSTACTRRADHRQKAEEYCSSWASVCSFFFSMLQSNDC